MNGDELRVAGVDRGAGIVKLTGKDGGIVAWEGPPQVEKGRQPVREKIREGPELELEL